MREGRGDDQSDPGAAPSEVTRGLLMGMVSRGPLRTVTQQHSNAGQLSAGDGRVRGSGKLGAAVTGLAVAVGLVVAPPAAYAKPAPPEPAVLIAGAAPGLPIPSAAFGQHVAGIARAVPAGVKLTSIRLWDAGTRWDQIETARDVYAWGTLDAAVDNAEAAGAKAILYVLGSTPQWAARDPAIPGLYGPGSTSLPRKSSDYVDFARKVAKRYKGRITAYQIWNEANTRSFYEGDWTALAKLTRRTHDAIKQVDPKAQVVAASSTVIPGRSFQTESFFVRYARALHKVGDPVDAFSVHLYPVDTSKGPDARVRAIVATQRVLNKVGSDRPVWDTEVNYGDRRAGLPRVVPDSNQATTYVARTYIDAATLGVARSYWYGWDLGVLGIDLTDAQGITPAGRSFLTTRDWLTDARPAGCQNSGALRSCHFTGPAGRPFTIMWSSKANTTVDAGGLKVCRLDGNCTRGTRKLLVDSQPILLRR